MSIEELEDTKGVYKSESINRRRTDNTMAKRKRTNNDRQNIHIKLIPQNECKTIYWDLQQLLLSTVLKIVR